MNWLITGGCGFVGSNLADALLSRGDDVVVLDNLSRTSSRNNLAWLRARHGANWRFVEIDVRAAAAVEQLVTEVRPVVIAHLAGQVAMTTSLQQPRVDFEINALGTLNVLEAVRQYSPASLVIYSSTNKVYGDLEWVHYDETETRYVAPDYPVGFDESLPLSFHSPYGCSKGTADQYMLDYARMFDLTTAVFRHSSMYGGRQFATYDQGWIGWFCQQALAVRRQPDREPFTISGNGKQVRDVLHADDIVALYCAAAAQREATRGQVFNVGGGMIQSFSLLELIQLLEHEIGVHLPYRRLPPRASDQKIFVADVARAQRVLGWQPRVSAVDGLRRTLAWLEESAAVKA
jgi:CDP-paratose 2-epimerase